MGFTVLPGHLLYSWVCSFDFFLLFKYGFNPWFQTDSPEKKVREQVSSSALWPLSRSVGAAGPAAKRGAGHSLQVLTAQRAAESHLRCESDAGVCSAAAS